MRATTDTRHLPVKLSDEELAGKAQELAGSVREEEEEREAFAAWKSTMDEAAKAKKAKIYIAHQQTVALGEIVKSDLETRPVPCTWLYTASTGFLRRDDTGELVQWRELREEERQATLPGTGGEVVQEPTGPELLGWAEDLGAAFDDHDKPGPGEIRFPNGVVVDLDDKEAAEREMAAFIREHFKG